MSKTFTYKEENEQGWLVEKVSAKEKEYFENWIPKRFKYDYPDPGKEMELGKDFEVETTWDKEDPFITEQVAIPITADEVKFKRGDKINLNTGYSCDIGFVEKDENEIVYWKHDLNDSKGRLYNTPKDKYNITLVEVPITQRTYSEQDLLDCYNRGVDDGICNYIPMGFTDEHGDESNINLKELEVDKQQFFKQKFGIEIK